MRINMIKQDNVRLSDVLDFGKYKGEQVEDLLDDDPQYLAWCHDNDVIEFDVEVIAELEKRKII